MRHRSQGTMGLVGVVLFLVGSVPTTAATRPAFVTVPAARNRRNHPQQQPHPQTSPNIIPQSSPLWMSSSSSDGFRQSSSSSRGGGRTQQPSSSSSSRNNNKKKSLVDRSPQEAVQLFQDVIQAALDAGPRAGPARTWQAYRAVSATAREFLPQLLSSSSPSNMEKLAPRLLRTLFERLGATYVKLGQFIASSPTLFPAEYVQEFQKCLDQTEPLPWSQIESVLQQELGGSSKLSETFDYIDQTALASASIAQVHRARLKSTGQEVVLKVQKPGIDESLRADLGFVFVAARVLEFLVPDWERTSLAAVAGDLKASMLDELDFEKEARNTLEFRRFLQDEGLLSQATAPRVYLEHTTRKVLTLEYLPGQSLLDEATVARVTRQNPQEGAATILTALNIWSLSVTSMPWFHADVHAGNLLLLDDGRIGFIDFGIVGRISEKVFQSVNELSAALATGDAEGMAIALCNMGATDEYVDTKRFGQDIERVLNRVNNVQADVTVSAYADGSVGGNVAIDESEITDLLLELVEVTENNGLKLPREFGLLVKQSLYFDRYLKILAPNVDVLNDDRVMLGGKTRANGDDPTAKSVNGDTAVIDV